MKNTEKPSVSVVIPVYNEEKYLPRCLKSIRAQTFKNYELIVVDNNSTDKTVRIAKKFGARVIHEKKQGMVPARERGFREAKAEIIARTDADTVVPADWLEKISLSFRKHSKVVAVSGPIFTPDNFFNILGFIYSNIGEKLYSCFLGQNSLLGPNMALRKSVWKKIQVCDDWTGIIEDFDLSYHLSKYGKIVFLPDLTVTSSTRKIRENPLRGIYLYLIVYIFNFYKTLRLHSN